MPTPGLSLVGFMEQNQAINHFKTACIPANPSDAALLAEWNAAKTKLGAPIPNAGNPDIQDIPATHQPYIQGLQQIPWIAEASQPGGSLHGAVFKFVEIDPLLAYQFMVDTSRADHHCQPMSKPPTIDQLLSCCLPSNLPSGEYHISQQLQSIVIKSRSLNLRLTGAGIQQTFAGINFNWTLPLVHVVRLNNKCYLHNGFHRTYGLRLAGATHVPCVFRDVPDHLAVGINPGTFDAQLLESPNPPTLAHLTQGRAHSVTLRATTRILHISWAEHAMYDE